MTSTENLPPSMADCMKKAARLLETPEYANFWNKRKCDTKPVYGAPVAEALTDALTRLEGEGWSPRPTFVGTHRLDMVTDETSVEDMLRAIVYTFREKYASSRPQLAHVLSADDTSMCDYGTQVAGRRCVTLLLQVRTGVEDMGAVDVYAWEAEPGRTFDDVRDLLVTAAEFARRYGPTAA